MTDLCVRDARPDDRDAIREVTLAAYQEYAAHMPGFWEAYRRNIVASVTDAGAAVQLVAERDGAIVGTVLLYPPRRMELPGGGRLEIRGPRCGCSPWRRPSAGAASARRSCRSASVACAAPAAGS